MRIFRGIMYFTICSHAKTIEARATKQRIKWCAEAGLSPVCAGLNLTQNTTSAKRCNKVPRTLLRLHSLTHTWPRNLNYWEFGAGFQIWCSYLLNEQNLKIWAKSNNFKRGFGPPKFGKSRVSHFFQVNLSLTTKFCVSHSELSDMDLLWLEKSNLL